MGFRGLGVWGLGFREQTNGHPAASLQPATGSNMNKIQVIISKMIARRRIIITIILVATMIVILIVVRRITETLVRVMAIGGLIVIVIRISSTT